MPICEDVSKILRPALAGLTLLSIAALPSCMPNKHGIVNGSFSTGQYVLSDGTVCQCGEGYSNPYPRGVKCHDVCWDEQVLRRRSYGSVLGR